MKRRIALAAQLAAGVCLAAFVGTALADNGKNPPGSPPGNSENAPGQQKKAERDAPPPAAPQPATAQPQPAAPAASEQQSAERGHGKPDKADKANKPAKADRPARAESPATAPVAVGTAQSSGHGRSDEAHHHVIICHRTGSDSNPYVVINIPLTAWHGGHTTHPSKNGRSDILLKDPASRPGSKDGFTKEDCEARAGVAPVAAQTTTTTTTTTQTTTSATTTTTTAAAGPSGPGPTSVSGPSAAGAQPSGVAGVARAVGKPVGGVLGVSGQLGRVAVRGQLPFTGLPLWSVALSGLALIGLGLGFRRRSMRATTL